MRPRGEIRQALSIAAKSLYQENGSFSWIQLAERSQVGYEKARLTVKDMANAGELVRVGHDKPAGSRVWVTLFQPAHEIETEASPAAAYLSLAIRCWAEFK